MTDFPNFSLSKYLGKWYEILHYPSWFQRNDHYNTTATYSMEGKYVRVENSAIANGQPFTSVGRAFATDDPYSFRVNFPQSQVSQLEQSGQFHMKDNLESDQPNYVIDRIWESGGKYEVAVVTDPSRQTLYVLSRKPYPSLSQYNQIISYVTANFDRDRLVATPHYFDRIEK